jgi:carbonic anhydrase
MSVTLTDEQTVTNDYLRNNAEFAKRLLGTDEIIPIHHTVCGMLTFTDINVIV